MHHGSPGNGVSYGTPLNTAFVRPKPMCSGPPIYHRS